MMLLKQFLFSGFSAIILQNAIHPARSKVGSPSALHCAKLNRLIPVIADVLHKLALGTQCGMQAKISAGVSLMHMPFELLQFDLVVQLFWKPLAEDAMNRKFKLNSMIRLAPQAQVKNFDPQHFVPSLDQSLSERHPGIPAISDAIFA